MHLFTELMINEEFACSASFTVCLSACLIHLSCMQKDTHDTFDTIDLEKIQLYAACCEEIFSETGIVDVIVDCVYIWLSGRISDRRDYAFDFTTWNTKHDSIVDSKITQNLES